MVLKQIFKVTSVSILFILIAYIVIYQFISLFIYDFYSVDATICRIIVNETGCTIRSLSDNIWTINPCPFRPSDLDNPKDYINSCVIWKDGNIPLPVTYYYQETSIIIYKVFTIVILTITPMWGIVVAKLYGKI